MRKSFGIIVCLLFATAIYGQPGTSFMARLPNVANGACGMLVKQQDDYLKQVRVILDELADLIREKKKNAKSDYEGQKDKIERDMANKYGLSAGEVQKLKNKSISKEEKKAIADRMMQEKTGISMDEIAKLKTMTKEGKKQWAKGYAEQQQANLSAGPGGEKSAEQIELEKRMTKDKALVDLTKEQQKIMDRVSAYDRKYTNKMNELIKKDSIALVELKSMLKPIDDKMNALPGPGETEMNSLAEQKRSMWNSYCSKITPIYTRIVNDCRIELFQLLPDFDRLEELNAEISFKTIGLKQSPDSKGLLQLEAVQSYGKLLMGIFNYGARNGAPTTVSGN